ncbi:cytochrome P450 9e2-like isoform X1 [Lasioglossum baleicum]|uniref:cytochrome P450 9e2-like isoform X1 n=1 Tax=Lasioglossum baleicum TaxID=434251 RepID=UPI003FCED36E
MASATLTFLVGALVLFVLYCLKTYTHWKRHKIPTPGGSIPFLGHMWPVYTVTKNATDHFESLYNQSKNYSMFGIYDLFTPALVVREPQLIKTVLQSNFSNFHKNGFQVSPKKDRLLALNPFFAQGETWSTGRKRLTLAFSNAKLKTLFLGVMGVAKKQEAFLVKHLKSKNKYECELKHFFGRFTAESVANAGLGVEGYSYEDNPPPNAFHTIGQNMFNPSWITSFLTTLAFVNSNLTNFLGIPFLPKEMDRFFRGVVHENLAIRLKDPTARNDFFQLMIEMETSEGKSGINEEAIAAHTLSLFFDGFETSRLTLSFVAYQLAVHPEIQEKLRDEIKSIIAENNGEMTFEGLKDLKYMEQVISESQRHNSALIYLKKECTEAYELTGSDGLTVKMRPGMQVLVPITALHHDPQYWSDPKVFDPDRFSDERKQNIEKMSFIPFGEGPRMCVGMRMAMLMMKCCLVSLLNNYKIELSPKTTVPLKFSKYHFFSEPIDGFWAYISKL